MKYRFKDLDQEQKEFISLIHGHEGMKHEEKMDILSSKFKVSPRTIRRWWIKLGLSRLDYSLPKQLREVLDKQIPEDTDIVFATSCQNKTLINQAMLDNMITYSDFIEEEYGLKVAIVVIPSRYRNPTSPTESSKKKADQWWVEEIEPYLYYSKLEFGDTLISADSRIRPTAVMPLSGMEPLAFDNHLVLGHSRVHFKTLPRFRGDDLRAMCTTGFISLKNYSSSKAGDKAFIHHSYGFTVIEKDKNGKCLIPRPVKVNSDGSFVDIIHEVDEGIVTKIEETRALVWGDIHYANIDPVFKKISYNLMNKLNPQLNVLHDVLDGESVNPHESKNMFVKKLLIKEGRNLIEKEINSSLEFLEELHEISGEKRLMVVESNHDKFLDRHINNGDWKKDLVNSEAYLRYALIQQEVDLREHGSIYGYLVNTKTSDGISYIKGDESLRVEGYQLGSHGHVGANGSRGNANLFKRFNTKMIHGHSHSPEIVDGVTCVGVTCNIWQYYNSSGMSSWANAHSVIHSNGKNQLLVFDDDYRLSLLIN